MKVLSITTAFLAAIFFAGIAVNSVMAAPEGVPGNPDCENFVDLDGDGVNDNCTGEGDRPQDGTGEKKGGRKGNGPGDGAGPGNPDCENFVDLDGDGVNDNCTGEGDRPQDGTGEKKGGRKGNGPGDGAGDGNPECPLFLDEDGDGINDNCPGVRTRLQDGTGAKRRINKRSSRGSDISGSDMAPGTQDRDQIRDDTCDGTGRKTRRGGRA